MNNAKITSLDHSSARDVAEQRARVLSLFAWVDGTVKVTGDSFLVYGNTGIHRATVSVVRVSMSAYQVEILPC